MLIGLGCQPRISDQDPFLSAWASIDEAIRNVVASGGDPERCALLDNFSWGDCRRDVHELGGIVRAVESGWPQREIARSAYRTQRQIDSGARAVVGVNRHTTGGATAPSIPTLKIDDSPERAQRAAVAELRARRDGAAVRLALDGVRAAAQSEGELGAGGNLMEAVLEAARREATLGEICLIFREVFGEYRDPAEV